MSTEVADVVNTFKMLAELPTDSLGAYVISMARSASDVLAVVLLQRECGVKVTSVALQSCCTCACRVGCSALTIIWTMDAGLPQGRSFV